MKKVLSLIIVAAFLFAGFAFAQVDMEHPDAFMKSGIRYLYGSNSFAQMTADNHEILINIKGEAMTDANAYNMIIAINEKYFIVTANGKQGVISDTGTELIAPAYDFIYVNADWALAYIYDKGTDDDFDVADEEEDGTVYYINKKIDLYSLKNAAIVTEMDRDGLEEYYSENGFLNIQDRDGNIHSYNSDGTAAAACGDSLYDFSWAKGDYSTYYDEDEFYVGLCDKNGKHLSDPIYSTIYIVPGKNQFVFESEDYLYGVIDTQGNVVVEPEFTEILAIEYGAYERCGVFAGRNDDDETITLIDTVNNTKTTVDVSGVYDVLFDGYALFITNEDNTFETIAPDGTDTVLPQGYEWISIGFGTYLSFTSDNAVAVDMYGQTVAEGSDIYYTPDGHLCVVVDDGTMVFNT